MSKFSEENKTCKMKVFHLTRLVGLTLKTNCLLKTSDFLESEVHFPLENH